ncbi:MAG: hypothetical protein KAR38_03350, partial [Calditrichia bacterium]|nr:hypothetical protein [Calditrichia bacterium]
MKKLSKLIILFLLLSSAVHAQVLVEEPTSKYQNNEWGLNVAIAGQGMGIGGFYIKNISDNTYLGANIAIYKLRDKYEYYLPISPNYYPP